MPPFRGPTPYRPIYYFGNKKSTTILVQMVERHQVRFIDKEMAMIRELAGTDDFLLACVRVVDCNEDLTPWVAPGIFGNSDFSGRGPQTLDYLLKEMIPMILHERDLALAGVIEPYSDFSSLFPPAAADSNSENHAGSPFVSPDDGQGNPHNFGFPRDRSFAGPHATPDYSDPATSGVRFILSERSLLFGRPTRRMSSPALRRHRHRFGIRTSSNIWKKTRSSPTPFT